MQTEPINQKEEPNPKRTSSLAPFAETPLTGFRQMANWLFIIIVFILLSLPLMTTFNELLTKFAEKTGLYNLLTQNVVPFETRAVSMIIKPLGIKATPTKSDLYISKNGQRLKIFFSWNCLGWQSAVLLLLTLITGLQGAHKWPQKLETILLGLSGTFLINLIRISIVVIIAYYFGQYPATIIHDYGGTLFTVCWFFFYWWLSYKYILEN